MSWRGKFEERGSALCVGLDPAPGRLPAGVSAEEFCLAALEATHDVAACVKPNLAFFEVLGPPGLATLVRVVAAARAKGLPVILDAKRGDVPESARAYAEAFFGGPFDCDALTVNPSLGLDAVAPFAERARALGRGVFLLLRTSNPGAALFQDVMEKGLVAAIRGEPVFGAVVGATDPGAGARIRKALPDTLFLVPGFGAQGGGDLGRFFADGGRGAVVNSSRGILYAGEGRPWPAWKEAMREAARAAHAAIERARRK
jgi:orotidine-5'-phosphate decarboxylase